MSTTTNHDIDENAGKQEDMGFLKAVLLGSGVGILIMTVVMAVTMLVFDPDALRGTTLAVAIWTGIWAGLFLGGTVSVGLWAHKRHGA